MPHIDAIDLALASAPELSSQPSLAAGASADGNLDNTVLNAQSVSQAAHIQSLNKAAATLPEATQGHHGGGLMHVLGEVAHTVRDPLNAVGGVASKGLEYLSKPLKEVQNDYRFIRDTYKNGGWEQGLLATALVGGAGIAAGVLSGGTAGALGADAAAALLRNTSKAGLLGNTLQQSAVQAEKPGDGSFGRDIASLIHFDPAVGHMHLVSGTLDGMFDTALDPLMKLGALRQANLAAKYKLGTSNTIFNMYHDTSLLGGINPVKRAVDAVAEARTGEQVQRLIPTASREMAAHLAKFADTPDDVMAYYNRHMQARNILGQQAPRLSWLGKNVTKPITSKIVNTGIDKNASQSLADRIIHNDLTPSTDPSVLGDQGAQTAHLDVSYPKTGVIQNLVQKATTNIPMFVDYEGRLDTSGDNLKTLRKISNSFFDPSKSGSVEVIRDLGKMSIDNYAANAVADAYTFADLNDRMRIYKNLVMATVAQMGLKDHPEQYKEFIDRVEGHIQDVEGVYGSPPLDEAAHLGTTPTDISKVPLKAPDGTERLRSAAIWTTQQGALPIPDFMAMRRAIGEMDKFRGVGYKINDALYHHLTAPVFKRLALSTLGFAIRVGSGEALYNVLDKGVKQYMDSAVARAAAAAGRTIAKDEADHRLAAMVWTFADKLGDTKWFDKRLIDVAADLHERNGAHLVSTVMDSDHYYDDIQEAAQHKHAFNLYKADQANSPIFRKGPWKLLANDDENFAPQLRRHLAMIGEDPGGQRLAQIWRKHLDSPMAADDVHEAVIQEYKDWLESAYAQNLNRGLMRTSKNVLDNAGGLEGFARTRFRALRGSVEGTRSINRHLLDSVADNTAKDLSLKTLREMEIHDLPMRVPGQTTEIASTGGMDRFFNTFHQRVTSPVINSLSRKQIYISSVADKMDALRPSIESGLMDKSEAYDLAEQAAITDLLPKVHNPMLRTQLHEITRNVMPFFFAQQQSLARWGRLARRDPTILRKIQFAHEGMKNSGFVQTDPGTGQEYFMYPGSGIAGKVLSPFLGGAVSGIPLSFRGNVASLASVVPSGNVGLEFGGPVFAVPLKALQALDPATSEFTQGALGDMSSTSGIWQELLPNPALRNLALAYAGDHSRAFESNQMAALKWVYAHHPEYFTDENKMTDLEMKHLLEQARGVGRASFGLKALLGMVLPMSPDMQIGRDVLSDDFNAALSKTGSVADAINLWQKEHPGKDVTPYTVFQSKTEAGPYVPASEQALEFYQNNRAIFSRFPNAASYLVPQTGDKSPDRQAVYNAQIALGLRSKKSPEEFQRDFYVAEGNAAYFSRHDSLNKALQGVGVTKQKDLRAAFAAWADDYKQANPVWANYFYSQNRALKRESGINELRVLYSQNKVPDSPQNKLLGQVLKSYDESQSYTLRLVDLRQTAGVRTKKKQVNQAFQNYLADMKKQHPELTAAINGLFWDGTANV